MRLPRPFIVWMIHAVAKEKGHVQTLKNYILHFIKFN
jgi:hypothetical protein